MNETPESDYEVAVAVTAGEREATFALRMQVFVEEQSVPPEEELDEHDKTATHFLARLKSRCPDDPDSVIAVARLIDKGGGVGKIGRVAVRKEHRGRGVGAGLMRFVEEIALKKGLVVIGLEAQLHAIPFYERIGYVAEGPVFLDAGIEHRAMHKTLQAPDGV